MNKAELNYIKGSANRGKCTWNVGLKYNKDYYKFNKKQCIIWNNTNSLNERLKLLKLWNIE